MAGRVDRKEGTKNLWNSDLVEMEKGRNNRIGFVNQRNYYKEYADMLKKREEEKNGK